VSIKRDLRAQPTRLLGREGDLEVIREVLRREEVRLLSLTGPAGVGKTRLAIEAGTQVSDDFAQGVVFVDLSPISDPTHVPQALARGADLQDVESPRLPERLFAYLRERNSLVILDNFEQLLSAATLLNLTVCPILPLGPFCSVAVSLQPRSPFPYRAPMTNEMIAATSKTKTPREPTRMGRLLRPPPPSRAGCCGAAAPPAPPVCGGGGTGTSASGVGTVAAWWTAALQFGQNWSSGLS
jgi:hypothetical protein